MCLYAELYMQTDRYCTTQKAPLQTEFASFKYEPVCIRNNTDYVATFTYV